MNSEPEIAWSVIESSPAGDALVGVFSSFQAARDVVSQLAEGRYEEYRIEGHGIDAELTPEAAWQVSLARDGSHLSTQPFAGCACADDEAEFRRRSFIARDGESMSVVVQAPTQGLAIREATRYQRWLVERDLWAAATQLEPLAAAFALPSASA
jgi:hypothetical protein